MTTVWLSLLILSLLAFLGCYIWLLVLAWRESTTWGLVSTFVPFGVVGFAVKFWENSKTQVILCTATFLILGGTIIGFSMSKVNPGFGENYGGADLWTDSSGFEAMDNTNEEGEDVRPESQTAPGETEESPQNEIPAQDTEPASPPGENPALDELANSEAAASEDSPPGAGHHGHKAIPLENLPSLHGERVALILSDGQRVFGVVEQVSDSKVVIRRIVGGGSILFTLQRKDIKEIRTRRWQ